MELLKIIVSSSNLSGSSCFLCSKQCKTNVTFEEIFKFSDDTRLATKSVSELLKKIVPSCDFLLPSVCQDCCDVMFSINTIIKTNSLSQQLFSIIIDGIHKHQITISQPDSKCKIKIKVENEFCDDENIKMSELELANEITIKCNKCELAFENETLLKEHKQVSHKTLNKALICDECGKSFKTPNSLKSHLNCHTQKPCPYCGKVLKTHSHFQVHVKQHANKQKRKIYRSIYYCDHCNYQSFNKMTLEAHLNKIHLNLRPYLCKICNKGFYKKSHLVEHNFQHYVDKQHTCEVCGESLSNKKCLDEHLRLHLGEKPYECIMCEDRFVTLSRRNEHVKRKHMEKSETCDVCGKQYSLKKELNRHMRQVHQREESYVETNVMFTQL